VYYPSHDCKDCIDSERMYAPPLSRTVRQEGLGREERGELGFLMCLPPFALVDGHVWPILSTLWL
jgi:hypothetical protein